MNSTMFTTGPAQAHETKFNISDYVNFDFDFEAPHEDVDAPLDIFLAEPLQSTGTLDPRVGYPDAVDADYAGIPRLPSDDGYLANNIHATQAVLESLTKTDALQSTFDIQPSLDEFAIFAPTTVAPGGNSAVFEIPHFSSMSDQLPRHMSNNPSLPHHSQIMREPSIWLPVSSQLQQHLNTVYASELTRQLDTVNLAPVLYFPAEQAYPCLPSSVQSMRDDMPRPELVTTSIDPSVLMHERTALPSQGPVQNGMQSPISPVTDQTMPDLEYPGSILMRTRTLDTNDHDNEPAPKRVKLAQAQGVVNSAREVDSDSDDEAIITRKKIAQQHSLLLTTEDDNSDCESEIEPESESENNRHHRSGESGNSSSSSNLSSPILPYTPVMRAGKLAHPTFKQLPRQGSNWRYERAQEVRLREQRRKEWQQRRTRALGAQGKAPDRKMQKLLKEIEDSEGFAEAQDHGVEGGVDSEKDRGSVGSRPVRKGTRKSYFGQG